jgi:hypothetical protein
VAGLNSARQSIASTSCRASGSFPIPSCLRLRAAWLFWRRAGALRSGLWGKQSGLPGNAGPRHYPRHELMRCIGHGSSCFTLPSFQSPGDTVHGGSHGACGVVCNTIKHHLGFAADTDLSPW